MPKQLPRRFLRRHSPLQFIDPDVSATVAKSLGEQIVVAGEGYTFENEVLCMPKGRLGARRDAFPFRLITAQRRQRCAFLLRKATPLLTSNLFRRDLDQLVSPR